jgi:hypothetical protein
MTASPCDVSSAAESVEIALFVSLIDSVDDESDRRVGTNAAATMRGSATRRVTLCLPARREEVAREAR